MVSRRAQPVGVGWRIEGESENLPEVEKVRFTFSRAHQVGDLIVVRTQLPENSRVVGSLDTVRTQEPLSIRTEDSLSSRLATELGK